MTVSVLLNIQSTLAGSQELNFGIRNLQEVLNKCSDLVSWQEFDSSAEPLTPKQLLSGIAAKHVVIILNPALVVSNNVLTEMLELLIENPHSVVAPADPRDTVNEWVIDYASLAGFERYVARRQRLPKAIYLDKPNPWMLMATTKTLMHLTEVDVPWGDWLEKISGKMLIAQHAFVHSYADYQQSDRGEMLAILPSSVRSLLDVGGGEGGFVRAFLSRHGERALLIEPNPKSSSIARSKGVPVLNAYFESLDVREVGKFDCISFLDVLEHLIDPSAALGAAYRLLERNGYILLSVPNVGHWSVVMDLLKGRFDYLPVGILCYTHVRFFTEKSLRKLISMTGFEVVYWGNTYSEMPVEFEKAFSPRLGYESLWEPESLSTESFHVLARRQ